MTDCASSPNAWSGAASWRATRDGKVHLTPAQLSMLLEGINGKHPTNRNALESAYNPL
ncbi:hypothetical protein ACVXHB_31415 [Escherichia coli]